MTIWFTADHHFGHANIIGYTGRPFSSCEEMDEEMIRRWNIVVGRKDRVYHLGDFSLRSPAIAAVYWDRLAGHKFLVPGGHDRLPKEPSQWPVEILPPLVTVNVGRPIVLCHYPMLSWDRSHYGVAHFHGHCHGTIGKVTPRGDLQSPPGQKSGRRLDIGVDCWAFAPVSLDGALAALEDIDA